MIDVDRLKNLIPLNTLDSSNLERLAKRLKLEKFGAGEIICQEGGTDPETIYLLSGKLQLSSTGTTMKRYLDAGTEDARYAVVDMPPRPYTVTAEGDVEIIRVGNYELDRAVMLDEVTTTITEITSDRSKELGGNTDWLSEMVASETFSKLPPQKLASLLMKLEAFPVKSGEVVVRQNDPGEYFYIIKQGRFNVSRKDERGKVEILNELREGSVFGEESLVSGTPRNANIVAMTDGLLLRLSRADFNELLRDPMLTYVTASEAASMVRAGAAILDVRNEREYSQGALKGSINIPVFNLREKLPTLDINRRYILSCQTGAQSEVAAFLLSQRGFDVCILKGGLRAVSRAR